MMPLRYADGPRCRQIMRDAARDAQRAQAQINDHDADAGFWNKLALWMAVGALRRAEARALKAKNRLMAMALG
jgi:hypothetical protein